MTKEIELTGDSGDYELLTKAVELSAHVQGATLELGLRRGGGTKFIMDAIAAFCPHKTHIAIDPYGNILYAHKEGEVVRLDYTNEMRDECLSNVYQYAIQKKVNFLFFNMEDSEYFTRFSDGVPIYQQEKQLIEKYSVVHFDGPHDVKTIKEEMSFFLMRTPIGGTWVFDDVTDFYDHDEIEIILFKQGFELIEKKQKKALYQKK